MVRILEAKKGEFVWDVVLSSKPAGDDRDVVHRSRDTFSTRDAAFSHMLMVHALMQIFVNRAAVTSPKPCHAIEVKEFDGKLKWNVMDNRGSIDESSTLFETPGETFENLLRVYTELTLFITAVARTKIGDSP